MSAAQPAASVSDRVDRPLAARFAVAAMFFINGALVASWLARIPAVQQQLGLGPGALGIALLGMSIGAVTAFPLAGWLIHRVGSKRVTTVAAIVYAAALPLPALAGGVPTLMLSLFLFGMGNASMDVAMNAQGVAVEKQYGRPILLSFHGLWSVGGLVGAAWGGLMAGVGVRPLLHFVSVAIGLGCVVLLGSRWLLDLSPDFAGGEPAFARPTRVLLALSVVGFCSALCEGAIGDWGAVYLHGTLGTSAALAASGYAGFSLAMTVGRLGGDRLAQHFGPVRLVRAGGSVACFGMVLALVTANPTVTIAGFACVGFGISFVIPLVFSAAGRAPGLSPGVALAAVATVGYTGFLVGPPTIGLAAQFFTLRTALLIVVIMSAATAIFGSAVQHRHQGRA